ncbi:MAG: hypothetical protein IJG09_01050 [Methanobrevibacter sp.]|nr:hypothetical protein [Methanobrevibacter sp.]
MVRKHYIMAKKELTINAKDFNLDNIGTTFELLDLYPVFNQVDNLDENGNQQFYKNGNVMTKETDEITGYMYAVKVLDGKFKRKTQTVKINGIDPLMTIEKFYNSDDVKIKFENLRNSYIGQNGSLSYLADSVSLADDNKFKKSDEKAGK